MQDYSFPACKRNQKCTSPHFAARFSHLKISPGRLVGQKIAPRCRPSLVVKRTNKCSLFLFQHLYNTVSFNLCISASQSIIFVISRTVLWLMTLSILCTKSTGKIFRAFSHYFMFWNSLQFCVFLQTFYILHFPQIRTLAPLPCGSNQTHMYFGIHQTNP